MVKSISLAPLARCLCAASVAIAALTCDRSPSGPSPLPAGSWGGDHIALTINATATHIEFDCAHGEIPTALAVDARNEFDVPGTFVREHGGPIREGEPADSHPARYAGSVTGRMMVLTVRLTDGTEPIGTYALSRDAPGRVVKCL